MGVGTEELILLLLLVLAFFSVFAPNLKCAVLASGAFGLWVSVAFLLYQAPDVALAEAVISGSLGTIIAIITIKNYNDITVNLTRKTLFKSLGYDAVLVTALLLLFFLTGLSPKATVLPIFEMVTQQYHQMGGGVVPIAAILLNYRMLDTLFEALMLLISGIAVAHLIKHTGGKKHE